ncbi:MAG TPA: PD-(D/E)XK nuclease family protein, partial [Lacipirellulaceae bacterium]|nr:PD-(D/E)XK nuclease family protein [Lacipirellulaceae bacterium]
MHHRPPGQATLVLGPAGSGKTSAALALYGAALRQPLAQGPSAVGSRRALWLAPARAAAVLVREALVDQGGPLVDPGVMTMADFAAAVLQLSGVRAHQIQPLQRRRLLGRTIAEAAAAGRLRHYAPAARSPGLVAIVDDAVAAAQRRGLDPAEALAEEGRGAPGAQDAAAADIALLYADYHRRLSSAGLIDAEMVLELAADALAAAGEPGPQFGLTVVDGYREFTTVERRLLAEIAKRSRRILITLPGDAPPEVTGSAVAPRPELFAASAAAAEWLEKELGAIVQRRHASDRGWPALAHLERNLFRSYRQLEAPGPAVAATLDRFHEIAASSVQAEIAEIARRVKGLIAGGAAPADVVVAFRTTRDVAERVRQTFADYGIPYRLDHARPLAASPLLRTLTSVLRLAAEDWPYRRVLQVAGDRSLRLFDEGRAGAPASNTRRAIETCVRYAQLPSGRRALMGQLTAWAEDAERSSEPTSGDAALAARALGGLAALLSHLPRRATIDRWVVALGALANELGLLHPATRETAANWSILSQALHGASRLDAWTGHAEESLTLPEILDAVLAVSNQAPAARLDDAVGRVEVLSAERARFRRPKHLFLGGLSEQSFPGARRPELMAPGDGASAAASARSAEMQLFYQLVTRPSETLTLSYPALDAKAQPLPASPLLVELKRALGGEASLPRTVQTLSMSRQGDLAGGPRSASELRGAAVELALDGRRELLAALSVQRPAPAPPPDAARPAPLKGAPGAELPLGGALLAGIETIAARGRRDRFSSYEGLCTSPGAAGKFAAAFGPGALWSPSRLETYAACPFSFFSEHLLRLRPMPELVLASDVRRRGSVLHETLARLYATMRTAPPDPQQVAEIVAERFHAALAEVAEARPGRGVDAAIREIERRQIAAWAAKLAQQDSTYRAAWSHLDEPLEATYFEARFGPVSKHNESGRDALLATDEPFELTATIDGQAEQVKFLGQVDRIDVGRLGDRRVFNIID